MINWKNAVDLNFIRLQRIFREVLEDEALQLRVDHSQHNLSGWDSFAQVRLIIGIEEEFGVKFSIDEVAETRSVSELLRLIEAKSGG
jgi:acyl carrier protein